MVKVYALQVRSADGKKTLYCFMEKSEIHVEMIQLQERFILSFAWSHHRVLKKTESKPSKYFQTQRLSFKVTEPGEIPCLGCQFNFAPEANLALTSFLGFSFLAIPVLPAYFS